MAVRAAVVASPVGGELVVTQVVLPDGAAWVAGADGPRRSRRPYASAADAVEQNSRSTTTAFEVEFEDEAAALRALGSPPPAE